MPLNIALLIQTVLGSEFSTLLPHLGYSFAIFAVSKLGTPGTVQWNVLN